MAYCNQAQSALCDVVSSRENSLFKLTEKSDAEYPQGPLTQCEFKVIRKTKLQRIWRNPLSHLWTIIN